LADHNAHLNIVDENGWTAIMFASRYNQAAIIELLCDRHADINMLNNYNISALCLASRNANIEAARVLLARGANVDSGDPPLIAACMFPHEDEEADMDMSTFWARRCEIVIELVRHNADLNVVDAQGHGPLYFAEMSNQQDIVAVLREAGCRVVLESGGAGGALADVGPALPGVDVFVPSLDEARTQTGLTTPAEIIACYRGHGAAGIVGVKCGAQGSVISPVPGRLIDVPCIPAPEPVVDTTGAGDCFLAGLIVGLGKQMPVEAAARLGAATAACCVTRMGATAGVRGFADTLRLAGL
jgi:ankyrin repeat protein